MTTDQERWREVAREVENALYNKGFQERINLIAIALAAAHREGLERACIETCRYCAEGKPVYFPGKNAPARHTGNETFLFDVPCDASRIRAAMASAQQDGDATKKPGD